MNNNIKSIYRLTPMQEGMLFHRMSDEESLSYYLQDTFWVEGKIEMETIRTALSLVSYKHEALNVAFVIPKSTGIPRQIFLENKDIECTHVECDSVDVGLFINELKREDMIRGFDLQKDSLVRLKTVYFKQEDKFLLLFSHHHIVMDGWCISLIFGDLMRYYSMLMKKMPYHEVKQLVIEEKNHSSKYCEYLNWMEKQNKEEAFSYWNELLKDYDFVAEIPALTKPEKSHNQVEYATISLSQEDTKSVKAIAKSCNVTINTIAEAVWGIILQNYTYSDDVVFGKVVSGRNVPISGIDETVGLFINTVPCRVKCTKDKTFKKLLEDLMQQGVMANEYSYCSLADIQNASIPKADLIKSLLVFENYEMAEESNEFLNVHMESSREQTNYNLNVVFYEKNSALCVDLLYNPDFYSAKDIEILLERIKTVLLLCTERYYSKVSDIELLSDKERLKILGEFNNTRTNFNREITLIDLFEMQVEKLPYKTAVVYEESELTYYELNQKANSLAHKLREMGAGPDTFIIIMAERSLEVIIGVCAILKAGSAYVPIPPSYPNDRVQAIIDDCKPIAILTHNFQIITNVPVIDLKEEKVFSNQEPNPYKVNLPNHLAYVIYTSGTTGLPKGVMIEQRSVVKLVKEINYMELDENTVVLQTGQLAFDASTFEIWGALLNGGRLHLISEDTLLDINLLKNYIIKNEINTMLVTTALFNQFVQNDISVFDTLNCLIFGGEATSELYVQMLQKHNNKLQIINAYGPTEATTIATTYKVNRFLEKTPIGKPISNTYIYILNNNRLCGVGMPGELCIAGEGLARGYLNRAELTKEKFIKNPYGIGNLYCTGDLVRWLFDGNIEYLGRIDEQVKIRGFRIEIAEIENIISKLKHIRICSVVVRKDIYGENAIYAYLVSSEKLNFADIRNELEKLLPQYMIPSYFMQINTIPLNSSGKVDKRALPNIEAKTQSEYIAPRNKTEEIVCRIFYEILSADIVGVKDSFFELGGHSLRATKLVNGIEEKLGVRLALKDIFINDTPEKLAMLIEKLKSHQYISIPKAEVKEYYPMSPSQKRIFLLRQLDRVGAAYNMPQTMRIFGSLDVHKIRRAVQELLDRHEILRTEFALIDGEPMQIIKPRAEADFIFFEDDITDEISLIKQFVKPFNLTQAPLMRVQLVKRKNNWIFMVDIHHIVGDGTSMSMIMKELSELYQGLQLEPLHCQYKDYSEWMRGRDISKQKAYWLKEFQDSAPTLDMPLDFSRRQEQSYIGATEEIFVSEGVWKDLKNISRRTESTDYMVFLTALMVLIYKYSGQEDIVVGSAFSGRTHKDTENILGIFVNTLVIRGQLKNEITFADLLSQVKERCILAFENQDYPFDELVEVVNIKRDMSRNPLFDVMLTFQNQDMPKLNLPGVEIEFIRQPNEVAQLDLNFSIFDQDSKFKIELEYCTDLYKQKSIRRMLELYSSILKQFAHNPQLRVNEVEIITEYERDNILNKFNQATKELDSFYTIIDAFEEQVEKSPNNTAIIFEEQELTFVQFDQMVNALANKLISIGVNTNDFVAIVAERSIEMIAGIYAILKAGAAYVPIEPSYPDERIQYILSDCKPKIILQYKTKINSNIKVLDIEEKEVWIGNYENPKTKLTLNNRSYCIYTSGTTGNPKGVVNCHRGTFNLMNWLQKKYPLTKSDAILLKTSYGFDFSVNEIFWWSTSGSKLVILRSKDEKEPLKILETIEQKKVTVVNFVPSMLSVFLSGIGGDIKTIKMAKTLKYCLACGETLNVNVANKFYEVFMSGGVHAKLVNLYGPTEASVFATFYECETAMTKVPIGQPLENYQVYILNDLKLCGVGIPGELCIAGYGLALGYLNQEELTNKMFINNPFGNGKLYRTGDLARWNGKGELEYIGRRDEQVKVRGFRIELGEIENVIRRQDGIRECTVIVRNDNDGDKAIYAYYVTNGTIIVEKLKSNLKKALPDYMIPTYYMQIEDLPVTPNGKLDKKALPIIGKTQSLTYVEPRDENERVLCKVLSEVLIMDKISVYDNFFELGGNSLKAIRVISKLREYGFHATLPDILHHQVLFEIAATLKEINLLVNEKESEGIESTIDFTGMENLVAITTEGAINQLVMKLLDEVKHKLKKYKEESNSNKYQDFPITGMGLLTYHSGIKNIMVQIPIHSDFGYKAINSAWEKVQNIYDVSRSSISINAEEKFIRIYEHKQVDLPYIDMSLVNETYKKELLENVIGFMSKYDSEQMNTLNNLAFKILLVKLQDGEYNIILFCSHIICDLYSIEILKKEFLDALNSVEYSSPKTSYSDIYQLFNNNYVNVSEASIIENMALKEYYNSLKDFKEKNLLRKFTNMNYYFQDESFETLSEEEKYDIPMKAFLLAMQHTYQHLDIPILMLHIARKNNHKDLFDCVGELLDLTPAVIPAGYSGKINYLFEEKLLYKQQANLFLASILFGDGSKRYTMVNQIFRDIFDDFGNIFILNHTGIMINKQNLEDVGYIEEYSNIIDINLFNNGFQMNLPVGDGTQSDIKFLLDNYLKENRG